MIATTKKPERPTSRASVLIVEDHPLVRLGLSYSLASHPRLDKCGEADSVFEAWRMIATTKPDAVIVDLTLRSGSGLDLIRKIARKRPEIRVVVSSMHDRFIYEARSLRAGATAYVSKESGVETLLAAVENAVFNNKFDNTNSHSGDGCYKEAYDLPTNSTCAVVDLTDRELEVFRLLGKGRSTKQIASALHRSVKTVESFRAKLKKKLGLASSEELVRDAVRWVYEHDAA